MIRPYADAIKALTKELNRNRLNYMNLKKSVDKLTMFDISKITVDFLRDKLEPENNNAKKIRTLYNFLNIFYPKEKITYAKTKRIIDGWNIKEMISTPHITKDGYNRGTRQEILFMIRQGKTYDL